MDQTTSTNAGLRPTRRQYGIFVAYATTGLAICAAVPSLSKSTGGLNLAPVVLVLSPWLLGLLVVLFDRPGPLRNWMAPLLLSLFYPIVALWYDVSAVSDWLRFRQPPVWPFAALLNVVFLGGFVGYISFLFPRRCASCGRRGLVPLLRLFKWEQRLSKTRWCACCNVLLWRDDQGQWQPERRRTWLDAVPERAGGPAAVRAPHGPGSASHAAGVTVNAAPAPPPPRG